MSVRSMTGFARVQKTGQQGEMTISVRSVNHRGLDIHFNLPDELAGFEPALRSAVRRAALRGHFQVRASFAGSPPGAATLNRDLMAAYLAAFRKAAGELGLDAQPDLNAALSLPGMLRQSAEEPGAEIEKLLVAALEEAMAALNAFREREGAALAADLNARAGIVLQAVDRIRQLRAQALPAFERRLSERLAELLGGAPVEPQRLAQEAAILADRSDIEEELTRLKVHADQVLDLLGTGGEVGKKLDFLLQEMGRETNTILSKTVGLGEVGLRITDAALAVKAEVEKIREQSQNLE